MVIILTLKGISPETFHSINFCQIWTYILQQKSVCENHSQNWLPSVSTLILNRAAPYMQAITLTVNFTN